MRWYLNQTVSLCKFGVIERVFFAACQTNCFAGEAFAAYDPCGNMISLIDKVTATEVWSRAVDKNSDSTIWIYNPYAMEIPISAQATIHPSYDQPINGPIEIQIPEQGQWKLKELLANLTKVNTTLGEMGIDVTIGGDDDCGDSICGGSKTGNDLFCDCMDTCYKNKQSDSSKSKYGERGHWEDEMRTIGAYEEMTRIMSETHGTNANEGIIALIGLIPAIGDAITILAYIRDVISSYTDKTELSYSDAKSVRESIVTDYPWAGDKSERNKRKEDVKNCLSSCSHHIDRTIIQWTVESSDLCG